MHPPLQAWTSLPLRPLAMLMMVLTDDLPNNYQLSSSEVYILRLTLRKQRPSSCSAPKFIHVHVSRSRNQRETPIISIQYYLYYPMLTQHSACKDCKDCSRQQCRATRNSSTGIRHLGSGNIHLAFAHPPQSCSVVWVDDLSARGILLSFFTNEQEGQCSHLCFVVRNACLSGLQ